MTEMALSQVTSDLASGVGMGTLEARLTKVTIMVGWVYMGVFDL